MPSRVLCLIVIAVLLAAPTSATSSPIVAGLEGEGTFILAAQSAALLFSGAGSWSGTAGHIDVVVIDDQIQNAIANPLRPDSNLVGLGNRTVTRYALDDVVIEWLAAEGARSIVQDVQMKEARLVGQIKASPLRTVLLDQSHFVSDGTVGNAMYDYRVESRGIPFESVATAEVRLDGDSSWYSWEASIKLRAPNQQIELRTGHWADMAVTSGSVRSEHFVHARLEVFGANFTVKTANPLVVAETISLQSKGNLVFRAGHGLLETLEGGIVLDGQDIKMEGGSFVLDSDGIGIQTMVEEPPHVDSVRRAGGPSSGVDWRTTSAFTLVLIVIFCAVPSATGWRLARASGARHGIRSDRSLAFQAWMSGADRSGRPSLAVFFAWRAVRNTPHDMEGRHEYGVVLRQAGRDARALHQHELVRVLLGRQPDPGLAALNDYNAALCCAKLGRFQEGLEWLQGAVEHDPSLAGEARKDPQLRALRSHPDFRAVVGM